MSSRHVCMSNGDSERCWEIAERALAEAIKLPWGPERVEAMKKAALMRLEATSTPELQKQILGKKFGHRVVRDFST